ncbi:MAG: TIGR00303 family protein [Proteobacteria bacterium]|nr:TIGR00303 family protein [Pseudomonadota bacterium]
MAKGIISVSDCLYRDNFFKEIKKREGLFICTIATTKTAEIPGISAAGATPRLRRYTAQADVEYLFYEKTYTIKEIPKNPLGPPSPVIITKACLNLSGIPVFIIDAGCQKKAKVPAIIIRQKGLDCITSGKAFDKAEDLFDISKNLAFEFAKLNRFIILGESVPAGTTTALSLMSYYGISAHNKVSSSIKDNAHSLKSEVVKTAHLNFKKRHKGKSTPFDIVSGIGDSMQIVNGTMALFLADYVPVILAGGSQMLAVVCFMIKLSEYLGKKVRWENISVCTTRWVLEDKTADFRGLSKDVKKDLLVLASDINFSGSKFKGLQMYEEGLVKEGVGAGGIAGAGFIRRYFDQNTLLEEIERLFGKMI